MSTPNDDAMRCAGLLIGYAVDHAPDGWPAVRQRQLTEAGEHIRRLVAENTAQREVLRQAVEAMESAIDDLAKPHSTSHRQAIAAINEHLKEQP